MSTYPDTNIPLPTWINWGETRATLDGKNEYPYYRKMTNLYGGPPGVNELQWVSEINTNRQTKTESADDIYGFIYDANPKYVWFLDSQSQKLKISEIDNEVTYNINPISNPSCYNPNQNGLNGCDNQNCCDGTSSLSNCLYKWKRESAASGSKANCGNNHNMFLGPTYSTCDAWSYVSTGTITTHNDYQDISGTFCNVTQNQKGAVMKTWIGCDCNWGFGGLDVFTCSNFRGGSDEAQCGTSGMDDDKIAYGAYPEAQRAFWQFIDEDTAFSCCAQDSNAIAGGNFPQCKYAFNPTYGGNSNKCPQVAQEYCKNYWGKKGDIGGKCQSFLVNSDANVATTQQTIQNYITSRSLNKSSNDESQPQDYISYDLKNAGDPLSLKYYTQDNTCFTSYEANGCSTKSSEYDPVTNPCCRDDSRDPFFTQTMPYLCNFQYEPSHSTPQNNMGSACDLQLQYFCQSFTRDQLVADIALQNICGCNLIVNPESPPINPQIFTTEKMKLERCGGTEDGDCQVANPSPYYVNATTVGENCDIICNTALIQSGTLGGKCTQQVCMIDNVTINQLNSKTGDTTITQSCDGGKCYIVDVDINEINSTTGGNNITQNCSSCYYTNSNDLLTAQPVDCGTLTPITPTKDEDGKSTSKSIFNKLFDGNIIVLLIFLVIIIVIIGFFIASYYNKKYEKKIETLVPPEGVIFGDDYWESY
jgi:hypothetical protein